MVGANLNLKLVGTQPSSQVLRRGLYMFRLAQRAFPYCRHSPTIFEQICANVTVSSDVGIKLRLPEPLAGCRDSCISATLVSMPEAAVNEDHCAMLGKNKVWSTVHPPRMKPETETTRVQRPPEGEFGLGVLSLNSRHHPGTGLLIYDVSHIRPGFRSSTYYKSSEP